MAAADSHSPNWQGALSSAFSALVINAALGAFLVRDALKNDLSPGKAPTAIFAVIGARRGLRNLRQTQRAVAASQNQDVWTRPQQVATCRNSLRESTTNSILAYAGGAAYCLAEGFGAGAVGMTLFGAGEWIFREKKDDQQKPAGSQPR